MKLVKIYCGRHTKAGALVSMLTFAEFLKTEVATQYDFYNIYYTSGHQQGEEELCFIIEIILFTDPLSHHVDFRPKQIANAYKKQFYQESVLITYQDVETVLV